jgi:hypothetical protein
LFCGHSAEIGVKTLKPPIGSGIVSGGGFIFKLSGLEPKFLNLILHANKLLQNIAKIKIYIIFFILFFE